MSSFLILDEQKLDMYIAPPYQLGIHSKTPNEWLKPWIEPNPTYTMFYFLIILKYFIYF